MKTIKRIAVTVLILSLTILIFRGWMYRHLITYKAVSERSSYVATNPGLLQYIDLHSSEQKTDIRAIIELSLSLTAKSLTFTRGDNDVDPNKLIDSKNAHCIGYAAYFSTICNRLLTKNYLSEQWEAKPFIGHLYFSGHNVHPYFKSDFFKDHDFAIIANKTTGEIFAVDPALNDYTGIDYVNYLHEN